MKKIFLCIAVFLLTVFSISAQPLVTVDASKRGVNISPTLYGIFFEDIRFAGDGGLYAELIRNRSFEDDHNENLNYWSGYRGGSISLVTTDDTHSNMINSVQEHAVKVVTATTMAGILNQGYSGMNIIKGQTYQLSFWAKGNAGTTLTARIMGSDKSTLLGSVQVVDSLTDSWKRYTATITPTRSGERGVLAIVASKASAFYLDVVSLFPPTFKDHPNGMRPDLAQMTANLKPAFMRFPGGCVVEGQYDATTGKNCRVEWKKQLGPIENRLGHRNNNWGYFVDDGLGVYEYFQFAEDIGAEPLYVFNIGMGHGWKNDYLKNNDYVQEAYDLIEFANGDTTTTYGRVRAEMGHPEPFGLKYVEIGNEAHSPGTDDALDHYDDRYLQFYKAIKSKYPNMNIIGDGYWNGDDWNSTNPVDIVDAHYYATPSFFYGAFNRYDNKDRSKYKYYIGEYAVTTDFGKVGNLSAALSEAVFMMGLERNSDVVAMASYAPMFCNDDYWGWWPTEMMHFNSMKSFGTPSYYIQKLFPNHLGTTNIGVTNTAKVDVPHTVGIATWNTAIKSKGLKITDNITNQSLITTSYMSTASNWTTSGKKWTIGGDSVVQADDATSNLRAILNKKFDSKHYTIETTITKTSGSEGFIIPFFYVDDNNYSWFNIGGWGNTVTAVEQCIGGSSSVVGAKVATVIKTGTAYQVKIVVDSLNATLYIDGKSIMTRTIKQHTAPALYATANINASGDTINLRVVNPHDYAQNAQICLKEGYHIVAVGGEYLGGMSGLAENSATTPLNVVPKTITTPSFTDNVITYTVPCNSANFITIAIAAGATKVNGVTVGNSTAHESKGNAIYNLSGQRVQMPLHNGIYIKQGKKIMISKK